MKTNSDNGEAKEKKAAEVPFPERNDSLSNPSQEKWISVVEEKVHNLRFGVIQITIHNGKVVQIDSTEKTRVEV